VGINIQFKEQDSNILRKKKDSVQKKYCSTKSKSIESANELAICLFSLNRQGEALEFLKSYSENSPFEKPRYERWEASCYAMLLQAHIEKLTGNIKEYERLISIVNNDYFTPSHWAIKFDFEEFINSINDGVDNLEEATKSEKLAVRCEGVLVLLNAYYIWSTKHLKFEERLSDIEIAIENELNKINSIVS